MTQREWDAAGYDRVAAPMTERGVDVVDKLELRGDETVLDAGCGSGRVTAHLLTRLPAGRVVALDGSRRMLDVAAELFGDDPRVALVHADLAAPLALDEPVDAIVSTSTFHWLRDHDALFASLAAVLRAGGALEAEFGGQGNVQSVVDILADLGEPEDATWTFATPQDTLRRLEAAGFAEARAELVPRPARIPPEELENYLRSVVLGDHVERLGPAAGERLVADVAARLPEPVLDYVRLVVSARR